MQVKLLRVLQERKFTPVGSNREIEMDVRIIAATNRNLEDLIEKGTFREDLFYRLNVIPIFLPPLRDRKDDIERLAGHFVLKFNGIHHKQIRGIVPEAMNSLLRHDWPGNIRELENVIEHAFVIEAENHINLVSLPSYVTGAEPKSGEPTTVNLSPLPEGSPSETDDEAPAEEMDFKIFREKLEKDFIIKALKTFKGRINQTAIHANIPKKTLLRKLQKYEINAEDFRQ